MTPSSGRNRLWPLALATIFIFLEGNSPLFCREGPPAASATAPILPEDRPRRAMELESSGRISEAIELYESITEEMSLATATATLKGNQRLELGEVLLRFARIREEQGLFDEAKKLYHHYLKLTEGHPDRNRMAVSNRLLSLYARGGDAREGIALAKELLKFEPRNYNYLRNLALLYEKEGESREAREVYKRMWELFDSDPDFRKYLELSRQLKDVAGLKLELEKRVAANPDDFQNKKHLGEIHAAEGDHSKAIDLFDGYLQRVPEDVECREFLADSLNQAGLTDRAITEFENIIRHRPDASTPIRRLGSILYKRGEKDKARELFFSLIQKGHFDEQKYEDVANFYIELGDYPEALKTLEAGQTHFGNDRLFLNLISLIYQNFLPPEEAARRTIDLLFREPLNDSLQDKVFNFHQEKGALGALNQRVEERWREVRKSQAPMEQYEFGAFMLDFYLRQNNLEGIQKLIRELAGHPTPETVELLTTFSTELERAGHIEPSLDLRIELYRILGPTSEGFQQLILWGEKLFELKRYEELLKALETTLKGDLDQAGFEFELRLKILYARGLRKTNTPPEKVFTFYSDILKKFPGHPRVREIGEDMIEVLIETNQFDDAIKELDRALENPAGVRDRLHFLKAGVLRLKNDFTAAFAEYEKILQDFPASLLVNDALEQMMFLSQNSDFYLNPIKTYIEAENCWKRGDTSRAVPLLEKILKEYPNSSLVDDARFKLVEFAIRRGDRPLALKMANDFLAEFIDSEHFADMELLRLKILEEHAGVDGKLFSGYQDFVLKNPKNLEIIRVKREAKRIEASLGKIKSGNEKPREKSP